MPLISGSQVIASSTNGTIDTSDKYAWGENIGWLNFGTTEGDITVTDSELSGYIWGENIGWISLNCSNDSTCSNVDYQILNDGEGTLSGHAWSENTGWIVFDPTGGGVTINSSGEFLGYAWGENIGWIVFNCTTTDSCATVDYKVKTDWLPQSARPACNNSTDDDSDGKTDYPDDPGCSSLTDTSETDAVSTSSTSSSSNTSSSTTASSETTASPVASPSPVATRLVVRQPEATPPTNLLGGIVTKKTPLTVPNQELPLVGETVFQTIQNKISNFIQNPPTFHQILESTGIIKLTNTVKNNLAKVNTAEIKKIGANISESISNTTNNVVQIIRSIFQWPW